MENIALIGIDLGKNAFHIHCQDRYCKAVYRKKLTRPKLFEFLATCPTTTIVMEACDGAHFMVRKLTELGQALKLISPQFVRPFVKTNKNDFVDAEAICDAAPILPSPIVVLRGRLSRLFADKTIKFIPVAFRNRLIIRRQRNLFQVAPDRSFALLSKRRVLAFGRLKSQPMQAIRYGQLPQIGLVQYYSSPKS